MLHWYNVFYKTFASERKHTVLLLRLSLGPDQAGRDRQGRQTGRQAGRQSPVDPSMDQYSILSTKSAGLRGFSLPSRLCFRCFRLRFVCASLRFVCAAQMVSILASAWTSHHRDLCSPTASLKTLKTLKTLRPLVGAGKSVARGPISSASHQPPACGPACIPSVGCILFLCHAWAATDQTKPNQTKLLVRREGGSQSLISI